MCNTQLILPQGGCFIDSNRALLAKLKSSFSIVDLKSFLTLPPLVIQMPHQKSSNRVIMCASYAVKKWQQAVKSYHAITYSTQAAYDLGFKDNKHVQHAEWMSLDLSLHHSLSSHHLHKVHSPHLASLLWGFLLLWESPLLQGCHPRVHQMVKNLFVSLSGIWITHEICLRMYILYANVV